MSGLFLRLSHAKSKRSERAQNSAVLDRGATRTNFSRPTAVPINFRRIINKG